MMLLEMKRHFMIFVHSKFAPKYKFEKKVVSLFLGQTEISTQQTSGPIEKLNGVPQPLPGELKPQPRMAPSPEDVAIFFHPFFWEWSGVRHGRGTFSTSCRTHFADVFVSKRVFLGCFPKKNCFQIIVSTKHPFEGLTGWVGRKGDSHSFFEFLLVQIEQI